MGPQVTLRQAEVLRDLLIRDGQTVGALAAGRDHWNGTWRCGRLMRERGLVTLDAPGKTWLGEHPPSVRVWLTEKGKHAA
jgi:hypothetical protein